MAKIIFVSENSNDDEFELLPHVDEDGNKSVSFRVNIVDYEHCIDLQLHRNAAIKLVMKIIETLK